jgi:hypothetical protein
MEVRNAGIGGPAHANPAALAQPPAARRSKSAASAADADRVDISPEARRALEAHALVQQVLALAESRPEAVQAARQALEAGLLDTPAAIAATAQAMTRPH